MAHIIFPAGDGINEAKRREDYPVLLADIVRGASDSVAALDLFRELVENVNPRNDKPGFMAFDAHGGETGCHLRAGMFDEIFSNYQQIFRYEPEEWQSLRALLDDTTKRLELLIDQSKTAYIKITNFVRPQTLGLGPMQDTPLNILSHLGWVDPEQIFSDHAARIKLRRRLWEALETGSDSSDSGSALSDNSSSLHSTSAMSSPNIAPTEVSSTGSPLPEGSCLDLGSTFKEASFIPDNDSSTSETSWNIFEPSTLIRVIVYSYILSKYKTFLFYNGSPNSSIDDRAANDYTLRLMSSFHNTMPKKRPGLKRLQVEFRKMQAWVSDMSCAWLRSLAKSSLVPHDMLSLIRNTTQKSKLGLTAAPCFPGYLLQREVLARHSRTLLLVDRHFCSHGYHVNVFEASVSQELDMTSQGDWQPSAHLGPRTHWKIQRTSINRLKRQRESGTPHIAVIGNSLQGPHAAYTDIIQSSLAPENRDEKSRQHRPEPGSGCQENETHIAGFLSADHDCIALSLFAIHPTYTFPLVSGRDAVPFVKDQMGGPQSALAAQWEASRAEADQVGTGDNSMHVFRWQHVCLESKGRLAHLLKKWRKEENLMPLKAPVEVQH